MYGAPREHPGGLKPGAENTDAFSLTCSAAAMRDVRMSRNVAELEKRGQCREIATKKSRYYEVKP
jgi:hypothetical protein